jgi:hypothetical protein
MQAEQDGEGDLNDVAMPGFIDILSSVITIFMFFMLITSAIMFFMSIQMKKASLNEGKKQAETEASEQLQDYVKKLQSGEMTVEQLNQALNGSGGATGDSSAANTAIQSQQLHATFSQNDSQTVTASDTNDLVIIFKDNGISVSQDTVKSVDDFIDNLQKKAAGKALSVDLMAPDNPGAATISVSREVALGRALNLRNIVLKQKITGRDIKFHNVPPEAYGNSYDWVRIHVS